MLERSVNGERENYVYDNNVVSMSKAGDDYFYMLDELGTGMYLTGTDGTVSDTYAYDEFGRSLDPCTGKEKPQYQKQGNILQPLAFTGYQTDEMTESYFAQARFYNAGNGRFVSEDKVRGYKNRPDSINHYLYCYNKPLRCLDLDGRDVLDEDYLEGAGYYTPNTDESAKKDKHPILIIGASAQTSGGLYIGGGQQVVIDPALVFSDPLHCIGIENVGGVGGGIGVSGGATVYVGALYAENITWTQGFGTEAGGHLGITAVAGAGFWIAGEATDKEDANRYGGYIALGEGGGAEVHVTITEASDAWYPLQEAYDSVMDLADSFLPNSEETSPSAKAGKKASGIPTSIGEKLKKKTELGLSNIKVDTDCGA